MPQRYYYVENLRLMKLILLAGLTGTLFLFSQASSNAATFSFSFINNTNGGGTVEGIIEGLSDNGVNQSATSVKVTSNILGFGIGEYIGNPESNSFNITNGVITFADFVSFGSKNSSPAITNSSLRFYSSNVGLSGGLTNNPLQVSLIPSSNIITFVRLSDNISIPESTSFISLLAMGLGGLLMKRKEHLPKYLNKMRNQQG